jgi:hypothetical protein
MLDADISTLSKTESRFSISHQCSELRETDFFRGRKFTSMEGPTFERPPDDYVFSAAEAVYVIDENGFDLWPGRIKKALKRGFTIAFDDDRADEKLKDASRILLKSEANNSVFIAQATARAAAPASPSPSESSEDELCPAKPKILTKGIVRSAWESGIRDSDEFSAAIRESVEGLMSEFNRYRQMMNVASQPLFRIGGNLDEAQIKAFWKSAKSRWLEISGGEEAVEIEVFIRKAGGALKLPNQALGNAKDALEWYFDPNLIGTVNFAQFAAFLAMFGPPQTAIRKLGHFLKCPPELMESYCFLTPRVSQDWNSIR